MPRKTTVYTKEDIFTLQIGVKLYANSNLRLVYPKKYFKYEGVKYELNRGDIVDLSIVGDSFKSWNITKLSDGSNQTIYTTDLISTLELINLPVFLNNSLNSSLNYDFVYNGRTFSVINGKINSIQNLTPAKVWIGTDNFNQKIAFYSTNSLYELAIGARLYTDVNLAFFDQSKSFTYENFEYKFYNASNMISNSPSNINYVINQNLTNSNSRLNPSLPDVFYTYKNGGNSGIYADRQLTIPLFDNLNQTQINQIKTNNSSLFNQSGQMNLYYNWGNDIAYQKVNLNDSTYYAPSWISYENESPKQNLINNIEDGVLMQAAFLKTKLDGPARKVWEQMLTPSSTSGYQWSEEDILRNIYNAILSFQAAGRQDLIPPFFDIKYDSTNGLAQDGKVVLSMGGGFDVAFDKMNGTVLAEGLTSFGEAGAPVLQPLLGEGMVSSPDGSNVMSLSDYMDQFLTTDPILKEILVDPQIEIVETLKSLNDFVDLFRGADGYVYSDKNMTTRYEGLFTQMKEQIINDVLSPVIYVGEALNSSVAFINANLSINPFVTTYTVVGGIPTGGHHTNGQILRYSKGHLYDGATLVW
jgi:hypothetical protein